MIILLMGVSGAGKTAVGETLASKLGWTFYDGDDFHPAANVHKMSSGKPLTDEDRRPWLDAIRTLIQRLEAEGTDAVIACSALKQAYRDRLLASPDQAQLVYLRGSRELIESRLRQRRGHFFDVGLLTSQFETLEEPEGTVTVEVDSDIESVASAVMAALELDRVGRSEQ